MPKTIDFCEVNSENDSWKGGEKKIKLQVIQNESNSILSDKCLSI